MDDTDFDFLPSQDQGVCAVCESGFLPYIENLLACATNTVKVIFWAKFQQISLETDLVLRITDLGVGGMKKLTFFFFFLSDIFF